MNKINALLCKEKKKEGSVLLWILAIIGVIVAVAGIVYALYRYFSPNCVEDFEEDFDEDDFFDEEDIFEDEGEY